MKKTPTILIVCIILLGLMACDTQTELKVKNSTSRSVWFSVDGSDDINLGSGSSWSKEYSDAKTLEIAYTGDNVFSGSSIVNVKAGKTTTFSIVADGGSITILNNSAKTIYSVYLSPSTDADWGDDDLPGLIYPSEDFTWTVSAVSWDIKVVDTNGDDYYLLDQNISLDGHLNVNFTGKKGPTPVKTKLNSVPHNSTQPVCRVDGKS